MHEEKLQQIAKERTQAVELLVKEWQEKYHVLQAQWQERKNELVELQRTQKDYDQMSKAFSNLKNLLGDVPPPTAEPEKKEPLPQ